MGKKSLNLTQFPSLLPYGFSSRHALQLFLPHSKAAWNEYSADTTMEERITRCTKDNAVHNRALASLVQGGYLIREYRKYGKRLQDTFPVYQITRPTLNIMTGAYDPKTEQDRIEQCIRSGIKRNIAEYFIDTKKAPLYDPRSLYEKAHIEDLSAFHDELSVAVFMNRVSPLGINTIHTQKIDLSANGINGKRQLRSWRISNIMALFQANGFLTRIDRRYVEPELNIKPDYNNEESKIPFFEFVYDSLKKWYAFKPESVSYHNSKFVRTSNNMETWKSFPVLYDATELPGFGNLLMDDYELPLTGATNILRHTFIGLAVGKTDNFLVYHTRPTFTPWNAEIESTSAAMAQQSFERMCGEKEHIGKNRIINKALIVCDSTFQFKELFEPQKTEYAPGKINPRRFLSPYVFLHILTVDQSSVALLNMLMKATPDAVEAHIIRLLLSKNKEFFKTNDQLFQLSYRNKPVLVAHTMEYHKLYAAYNLYKHNGQRFYISCYPEQAAYLAKLLPECEFL